MDNTRVTYLYERYLNKSLNHAELDELSGLLGNPGYEQQFIELVDAGWAQLKAEDLLVIPKVVENRVFEHVVAYPQESRESRKVRSLWYRIAMAAAVVFLLAGIGLWFFNKQIFSSAKDDAVYANDVAPGRNTATLTLANGKTIALSDAKSGIVIDASKLTYNDGSKVRVSSGSPSLGSLKGEQSMTGPVGDPSLYYKAGQLTASTPRGGQYQVVLPDGTRVWLNAASSLKFPAAFTGSARMVELSGEGYFEVAKNRRVPFIVTSKGQKVEVLGTHFNINSYADESSTKTTLLEGSVKVNFSLSALRHPKLDSGPRNGTVTMPGEEVIIKPGQQALFTPGSIKVKQVNVADVVSWKNGIFDFEDERLDELMRKVERWYNVEVFYNENLGALKFTGSISRYDRVSKLFEILETTGSVHFKIEGRKIYVSR